MSVEENDQRQKNIHEKIFDKIAKNDNLGFEQLIMALGASGVDFLDSSGMTPLQHACCKGNIEAVKLLLDLGANANYNKQGNSYTTLHFAALSGKTEICRLLLDAGVSPYILNSVNRTAAQMAAFVGNHDCVETINNYVPFGNLEEFAKPHGTNNEPLIPLEFLKNFQTFIITTNLHPVRIVLNLQDLGLIKYLHGCKEALGELCDKEMKKTQNLNELIALKFHYLRWIIVELLRCEMKCKAQRKEKPAEEQTDSQKTDFVEMFIKRVLKENKHGQLDFVEYTIRECIREYPFRDSIVFRKVVQQLASTDDMPALMVLKTAINGPRPFQNEIFGCSTCGTEKPDKKCSKCRAVQYCDRECQRLHWFMHKKTCARPTSTAPLTTATENNKGLIDVNELRDEISKLTDKISKV